VAQICPDGFCLLSAIEAERLATGLSNSREEGSSNGLPIFLLFDIPSRSFYWLFKFPNFRIQAMKPFLRTEKFKLPNHEAASSAIP